MTRPIDLAPKGDGRPRILNQTTTVMADLTLALTTTYCLPGTSIAGRLSLTNQSMMCNSKDSEFRHGDRGLVQYPWSLSFRGDLFMIHDNSTG